MSNPHERQDKIVRMKVQTAKVLWQENRREAAYLVLESVDDPRADDLRQHLGFHDEYEPVPVSRQGVFWTLFASIILIAMVLSFALGTLLCAVTPSLQHLTLQLTAYWQVLYERYYLQAKRRLR